MYEVRENENRCLKVVFIYNGHTLAGRRAERREFGTERFFFVRTKFRIFPDVSPIFIRLASDFRYVSKNVMANWSLSRFH